MLVKSCPVKIKAAGEQDGLDEGVFEAIVSVFGNVDSYGDVVMPGAFADSLAEWETKGDPIPVYWSHRMDDPDYNIGHVLEARETDEGLWVKAQLDVDAPKAAQVHRLLKGRRVTQFSFAYDVIEGAWVTKADKAETYELRKLKIYEVGPTPIGANQETELLAVKSAATEAEHLTRRIKAGRVISAKNESELRKAHEAIGNVLSALDTDDQEKASANAEANAEEPDGAKAEELQRAASVDLLAAEIDIIDMEGEAL